MATMLLPYRKPFAICNVLPELEGLTAPEQILAFAKAQKTSIEQHVMALGLRVRLATQQDIDGIRAFQNSRFAQGTEDPYVLFRIVRFGFAPLIESPDGRIVACNPCQSFDDPDRTLWAVRNSVDPSVSGNNLASVLAAYSSLIGMERGARVRRAFVAPTNYASAANNLNYVGFIAEAMDMNVPGHQGPRFSLALPLTAAGVKNNRIDFEKMGAFMNTHQAGHDYVTVVASEVEQLADMYASTPFRVVAFLKAGRFSSENAFLAVPKDRLSFPESLLD